MAALPLTLFASGPPVVEGGEAARLQLDACCWVDVLRGYVGGADQLLADLEQTMAWHRGRRLMYGTWYDEPRLSASEAGPGRSAPAIIEEIRDELTDRYRRSFRGLFCNYYVDGHDSVAWHADRIGRTEVDPLVAIVSVGGPRTFAMRPHGGGESYRIGLHSGDLLVMGGATQHHWEHSVPKTRSAPPRISVTMRASGPPLTG